MTISQSQAVWELCRQGLPLMADDAEILWQRGETFQPDTHLRLSREALSLIERSNWEASRSHLSRPASPA